MKSYTYLIVGGGLAADAAVRGIREEDPLGSIALLTRETDPPYHHPPLPEELWADARSPAGIDCGTAGAQVDVLTGRRVVAVRPDEKVVVDQQESFSYQKLLLAPGGTSRTLSFPPADRVVPYRTLQDRRTLKRLLRAPGQVAVIGGSFVGCEVAEALLKHGCRVTMIFPEQAPFRQRFPRALSLALLRRLEMRGADVIPGVKLSELHCSPEACRLVLEDGRQLRAAVVVVGIGIRPNVALAESAGLAVDDGILVNRQLQTSHPQIYAAGDACRYFCPALNRMLRVDHKSHALASGRIAGRNMAGQALAYGPLPSFSYSLFGGTGEAVGLLDGSLQIEGIWRGIHQKGVWAYLENRRVCGVLMWNLSGQTAAAHALIQSATPFDEEELRRHLDAWLQ